MQPILRAQAQSQFRLATRRTPTTALRTVRQRQQRRFASNDSSSSSASPAAAGGGSGAIAGGVAGGVAAFVLGYSWYKISGTSTIVGYANESKKQIDQAFKSATEKAPKPNEAITWLKQTVTGYTKLIPGANQYVEQAFADVEKVQEKHGDEVEKIIGETYDELKDITKQGASLAAATQAWEVLQKCFKQIANLAGDAAQEILNNHPELKEKIGGQTEQLQKMAQQYGPEAKKQFDDTIKQVQDIIKGGLSSENIQKAQKLVEDKTQELKKQYGDLSSGGGGSQILTQVMGSILPNGGKDIASKFQELQELGQKHGKEAENLLRSASDELKQVLDKKVKEGEELKEKAKEDVKN